MSGKGWKIQRLNGEHFGRAGGDASTIGVRNRRGSGCEVVEGELLKKIRECAAGDPDESIADGDVDVVMVAAWIVERGELG